MSIKITQIELSKPLKPLRRLDFQISHVWALVRLDGEPLGWLKIQNEQLPLSAREVGEMIAKEHTWPIYEHGLRKLLDSGLGLSPGTNLIDQSLRHTPIKRDYPLASVIVYLPYEVEISHLAACLEALQEQDHPNFEVILAVNGTLPAGVNQIAERGRAQLISGTNAFYRAVQEARGEFVSLTGAAAMPDKSWLRGVADAVDNPTVAAIGGPLFPFDLWTQGQIIFENHAKRPYWFVRYYNYDQLFELSPENFGTPLNASFRRSFLLEECNNDFFALDFGLKQMLHLYYRALKRGFMVGYEPNALVWEHYPEQEAAAWKQLERENIERAEFLAMAARANPGYRKVLLQKFRQSPATKKTLVRLGLREVQRRLKLRGEHAGRSQSN